MILKISIIPEEELRNLVFYETVALDFLLLLLTQAILAIYISLLTLHSDCAILLYAKKLEKKQEMKLSSNIIFLSNHQNCQFIFTSSEMTIKIL